MHGFTLAYEHAVQRLAVLVNNSVSSGLGTNIATVQSHTYYLLNRRIKTAYVQYEHFSATYAFPSAFTKLFIEAQQILISVFVKRDAGVGVVFAEDLILYHRSIGGARRRI